MSHRCFSNSRAVVIGGLAVIMSSLFLAGCASSAPVETSSSEAFATAPVFSVNWRQQLNPVQTWDYRPREYAAPHYRPATGEMYVGTDAGTVFKVRGGNGELIWRQSLDGAVHAVPVFGDGRVYVGTMEGGFYALDAESGEVDWQLDTNGAIESQAAYAEGRVFVTTSNDVLMAMDAATGKDLWSYRRDAPEYFTVKETGRPVVDGDAVLCGFADGVMAAVQIDSGKMLWESDLSGGKTEFIDASEEPIVVGERIYAASYDGGLYALDRMNGEHIWRQDLTGIADFVYGEQFLYAASAAGRVVAMEAQEGEPQWAFRLEDHTPVNLTATQLYLFVSTSEGPLYVLDRLTGVSLMSWDPSDGFNTPLVLGHESVFLLSNRGYLYGIDVAF
jgi:outer membrane protein assembly factor BamB